MGAFDVESYILSKIADRLAITISSIAALVLASPSLAQDAGIFDKLGSANVDMLTFGAQALQTELNINRLQSCYSGCKEIQRSYNVFFKRDKPDNFPAGFQWPAPGIIVIVQNVTYSPFGEAGDPTAERCESDLKSMRLSEVLTSFRNFGAFFLPIERAIQAVTSVSADAADKALMADIRNHIFLRVVQTRDGMKPNGTRDKYISVACGGMLTDEKVILFGVAETPDVP